VILLKVWENEYIELPKERIINRNIAEQLNVSKSLVQQVFTTLIKKEFLVLVSRSSFYVREITKKKQRKSIMLKRF